MSVPVKWENHFRVKKNYVDSKAVWPGCYHSTDNNFKGKREFIGLNYEGNVTAMLNNYYFGDITGNDTKKLRAAQYNWEISSSLESYNYPSFGSAVSFIQIAGSGNHNGKTIFNSVIKPYCNSHEKYGRNLYCNSPEFNLSMGYLMRFSNNVYIPNIPPILLIK